MSTGPWLITEFEVDSAQTTGSIGVDGPVGSEPPSEQGAKPKDSINQKEKAYQHELGLEARGAGKPCRNQDNSDPSSKSR
ncbi:hypothetical protein A3195_12600 [Candidatus Thiodiazotropha endoloripes]|uniref:Uncharacterized protein n=1 Tax=Candidatus Thiodiazotropha endoloripes TaxID=1818881 RepID=A0A1E2USL2_9GAMM|nr:hypothetical protein A3195_12600 [Candidatus Thiodiazotropha endoloripes]ODB88474.1 hypothetical protein A3193_06390 [Candidatus Thiodiazotropha endoloripes]ODB97562.1 hypothetical protein A3196_12830 [Candidatus Thiodiazotropha endoloripes]